MMLSSIIRSSTRALVCPNLTTHPSFCPASLHRASSSVVTGLQHQLQSLSAHQSPIVCGAAPGGDANTPSSNGPPKLVLKYRLRPLTKDDVETSYARSGGPGGQNVNKVNTKVDMRWEVDKATWVPDDVKEALRTAERNRFTKEGVLVLTSTKHRNQSQNFDDALSKLQEMVDRAVVAVTPAVVDPATVKRVKAQMKAGQEHRLQDKRKDSERKSMRSSKNFD